MSCFHDKTKAKYHQLMKELRDLNSTYVGSVSHWASLLRAQVTLLEELLEIPRDENGNRYHAATKDSLYGYVPEVEK